MFIINMCPASHVTEDMLHEEVSDRAMMRALPEEERIKIQQQVQMFRIEKAKLDREVAKWDESGNDIIIIAKQMCMIMMEMTDFTRFNDYNSNKIIILIIISVRSIFLHNC